MSQEKQKKGIQESNENNYVFGISQKAIIYDPKEDKFLLVKSSKNYFSEKYGPWELIGGTMHQGDSLEETLNREIKEEAGEIEYKILDLVASEKIIGDTGKEKIIFGNLVELIDGEIELSEEHAEYKWESYKNIMEGKEYKSWLKNFVQKAQQYIENKKSLAGWKRCQADFENYKKMQAEMQKEFVKYAAQNVVMQIIPVLDNFHMSTDHIPEDQKNGGWVVGIMHIQKQLENVLKENGVEEIETKEGDEFNPEIHEAVSNSNDSKTDSNNSKIQKIVMKGYKMGNKIIRPVKVIVN